MSYHAWQGLVGGAAGVVAMSMLMQMAVAMGMTRMQLPVILGSMITRDEDSAKRIGMMWHFVNGLIFGLIYAGVWKAFDITGHSVGTGLWVGALFGAVHGIAFAMVMPMMSAMHPRAGGTLAAATPAGEVRLPSFGVGGKNFGSMTPMGVLAAHVVYGLVWGAVFVLLI